LQTAEQRQSKVYVRGLILRRTRKTDSETESKFRKLASIFDRSRWDALVSTESDKSKI